MPEMADSHPLQPGSPSQRDPDSELVAAARSGDRACLEELLRRHHDRIYTVCTRITGNPTDGADACQNALLAVVSGLGRFDGRARFSTWVYRVATNAALDEVRRQRRRPEPRDWTATEPVGMVHADLEATTDRVVVDAALAQLRPDQRAPVVLRDLGGLSYEDISDILGLAPGTVRSRIARGRASLARALAAVDAGNQPPDPDRQNHEG